MESRQLLAGDGYGWFAVTLDGQLHGTGAAIGSGDRLTSGVADASGEIARFQRLNNDGTINLNPIAGPPGLPENRVSGLALRSFIINSSGQERHRDFRMHLPADRWASYLDFAILGASENFTVSLSDGTTNVPNQTTCVFRGNPSSVDSDAVCGNLQVNTSKRRMALEPDRLFNSALFDLANGGPYANGGPENWDDFHYFVPGFDLSPTEPVTPTAGDGSETFSMSLQAAPEMYTGFRNNFDVPWLPDSGDVTVSLLSSNSESFTVEPSELTFNASNWDSPQAITVRCNDDARGVQPTSGTIDLSVTDDSFQLYRGLTDSVAVVCESSADFGDAPAPYPTLMADNGPRHAGVGATLGVGRDVESDGAPTASADGDDLNGTPDDEDGVIFASLAPTPQGQLRAQAIVDIQNADSDDLLQAWIDFNGDGDWDDALEQVALNVAVSSGENTITFDIPGDAQTGASVARFRVSSTPNLGPTGPAPDGEVEDHYVDVVAPPAPEILGIDEDTGVPGDRITDDQTLDFFGSAAPGAVVTLTRADTNDNWSTTAADDGTWTVQGIHLEVGDYTFIATAQDAVGNTSIPSQPFETSVVESTERVEVNLVVVAVPTAPQSTSLPPEIERASVGSSFFIEAWVREHDSALSGVSGGRIDVLYETALSDVIAIEHLDFFNLPSGEIDDAAGIVIDLGGGAPSDGLGNTPEWARLAYVEVQATAIGSQTFRLEQGSLQFALNGGGNVPWSDVDLKDTADVEIVDTGEAAVTVTRTPTPVADTGQVDSLPTSDPDLHEWEPYVVEVWAKPQAAHPQITSARFTVPYNTSYTTAVEVEVAPSMQIRSSQIDDAAGLVNIDIEPIEGSDGLDGEGSFVLLARIRFAPIGADQAPVDEVKHQFGPYDLGIALEQIELTTGETRSTPRVRPLPMSEVHAVIYDIDDSNLIDFGDFSYFVPAFARMAGDDEPPYTRWADFDGSGLVDFGDFAYFALNFAKSRPDASIVLPARPADDASGEGEGSHDFRPTVPSTAASVPFADPTIRNLMSALHSTGPFHNPRFGTDVDNNRTTTPLDALRIINALNGHEPGRSFLDVNADGALSASDVASVFTKLQGMQNRSSVASEGEGEFGVRLAFNPPVAPSEALDHVVRSLTNAPLEIMPELGAFSRSEAFRQRAALAPRALERTQPTGVGLSRDEAQASASRVRSTELFFGSGHAATLEDDTTLGGDGTLAVLAKGVLDGLPRPAQ